MQCDFWLAFACMITMEYQNEDKHSIEELVIENVMEMVIDNVIR